MQKRQGVEVDSGMASHSRAGWSGIIRLGKGEAQGEDGGDDRNRIISGDREIHPHDEGNSQSFANLQPRMVILGTSLCCGWPNTLVIGFYVRRIEMLGTTEKAKTIGGDKLYQKRSREAMPLLVEYAESQEPVSYVRAPHGHG